ncbi:hypothetical protein Tco_0463270, partial [Tanacetum coccineum]
WIWVGHPDGGSNSDGIGGGDEYAGRAVHLARCSPAEGGNSERGGDGDGGSDSVTYPGDSAVGESTRGNGCS